MLRAAALGVIAPVWLALQDVPAHATGKPAIAGDYVCVSDCRPSDAPPSIEIQGSIALCRSELGGIYTGRLLSARSVDCFNKTGALSDDGTTLLWSNGGVWKRR